MRRELYGDELPTPGETRYVRLSGEVCEVRVQPFQERLIRELGGRISAKDPRTGVYRNFLTGELKRSPSEFRPHSEPKIA